MYQQEISRTHKGYFVFLLDQSTSMEEPMGGSVERKMDVLARAINGWLQNITIRATGGEGVKDWMDVSVIGYRTDTDANPIIEPALVGPLAGREVVSIRELAEHPARIEKRTQQICDEESGEILEAPVEVPVWVETLANGGTPMCSALYKAYELVSKWIENHRSSFPPVVIHITDGESQEEGDVLAYAEPVKELATDDGEVILFNCHLSMTAADPLLFPHNSELLPDELAKQLFQMSSKLPDSVYKRAVAAGFDLQSGARGMAFNCDMVSFIKFLDMGTRVASLR